MESWVWPISNCWPRSVELALLQAEHLSAYDTALHSEIGNLGMYNPVLAGMESSGAIKIAGAMYNLQTGVVEFFGG